MSKRRKNEVRETNQSKPILSIQDIKIEVPNIDIDTSDFIIDMSTFENIDFDLLHDQTDNNTTPGTKKAK